MPLHVYTLADLLARSVTDGTCLVWTGATNRHGYGVMPGGRLVHRYAWQLRHGPLPRSLDLDHLCRRPPCWLDEHLEAVTHRENIRRGALGFELTGRCRAGLHDTTGPANVYVLPNGDRRCRACKLASNRAQADRSPAAAPYGPRDPTRCRSGAHDMTDPSNVYTAPKGDRRCRACRRVTQNSSRAQARRRATEAKE